MASMLDNMIRNKSKKAFKDALSKHESIIYPDLIKDDIIDIEGLYTDEGIYLIYEYYFVMKFLDEAPGIIIRAMQLRKIFIKELPSKRVTIFVGKRIYPIYQAIIYNASATLLRSIIETILKEKSEQKWIELWLLNEVGKEFGLYGKEIYDKIDYIMKKKSITYFIV